MKIKRKTAYVISILLVLTLCLSMVSFGVAAANSAGANIVHQVSVLDVCAPYAEYYPDYDFTLGLPKAYTFDTDRASDESVVNGCWWYDETTKSKVYPNDAFIKGHVYSLIVLLEPCEGYEFQVDNYDTPFIKAYVNGNLAVVDDSLTGKYSACVEYTFAPSDYNMEVEYTKLTVTEPKAGEHPDFSAKTDRTSVEIGTMASPHYIEGVAWYDCDNHVFLDPSDKFAEDGNYEVYVVIKTTGDFYFSTNGNKSDVQVKVNGKVAESGFSGEDLNHHLLVTYVFGEKFTEVSKVEIRNLTLPVAGANPDFELTPFVDYAYYINAVYWTDKNQTGHPITMKETDTFEAGHTYELQVWLRVKDGYKFRLGEDDCVDIVAYINSDEAEVVLPGAETSAIITMMYTLSESRVISEVDVIGVDTPYIGRTPDYEVHCTTKGCNVTEVEWYDVTDGGYVLLGENDTFVAGHIYRVNVMVETEGDYTFLMVDRYNEAWGYINGMRAIAGAADEDFWLQLGYVFAPTQEDTSRIISEFEVFDIENPSAGNLPDINAYTITPGCEVAAVEWYDYTDGSYTALSESTPFEEGRIYRVVVTVEAGAGYTFLMTDGNNKAVGYIDGKTAIPYGSGDEFLIAVALEFEPCEGDTNNPTEGTTEVTTPTEPSESTSATTPTTPVVDKGILGDVNGDGKVNIKDATQIQKFAAKLIDLTDAEKIRADVNADTKINIKDATAIQKFVAKIETGLAIGKPIA